jgi:glycosyltransferase involved in cell wall biosynthesis
VNGTFTGTMRILILDTLPIRRGAQIFASDLGMALVERGHAVKKVYLYEAKESVQLTLQEGDVVLGGNAEHVFEKFPSVHPGLVRKLVVHIHSYQPDLVLLNGSRTYKYGALAKFFLKKKPVFVFRMIDSVVAWNRNLVKQLYYRHVVFPAMDGLVSVSQASLNDFQKLFPCTVASRVIHRSVDPKQFAQAPSREEARRGLTLQDNHKVLLFLGSLTEQKRPIVFVEIVSTIYKTHPDVRAVIVGDGPLRKAVENRIAETKMKDVITVWGYQENVLPFLVAADVLVLTSSTEGVPGVVLEAGLLSVPVVSTLVGGMTECVENGKTGFLIREEELHSFPEKVIQVLVDDGLRLSFGTNARQKIMEEFSWQKVIDMYEHFLGKSVHHGD